MEKDCQILIIGGGINGCALARLCAYQGLKTILIEKNDFASGTSSASSKLLHGGLRYLENLDYPLVREAVIERKKLLDQLPNLVTENRFYFPDCSYSRHHRYAIKLGISLYEILSGRNNLTPHKWINATDFKKLESDFLPYENKGSYIYSDCAADDSRLVMENAIDAKHYGAHLYNYTELLSYHPDNDHCTAIVKDINGKESKITCKKIAFCTGPWTDKYLKSQNASYQSQMLLSGGAHLLVEKLHFKHSFILPVPNSKRFFFVLPYKGQTLIGTTETAIQATQLDKLAIQEFEKKELLSLMQTYFPNLNVNVICSIAGARPLVLKSASQSSSLSRRHLIKKIQSNIYTGIGGKYTTHRTFAEDYLKKIWPEKIKTLKDTPFINALKISPELISDISQANKIPQSVCQETLQLFGKSGQILLDNFNSKYSDHDWNFYQYQYCQNQEWVKKPEDFLRRRTSHYFTPDAGLPLLEKINSTYTTDYLQMLSRNQHIAAQ
jgi:glycerol-3-phosphate dehydrogenase